MSWNEPTKRKWSKADWALWLITIFALIMASIALLSVELRADEIEPYPTQSATSWVATPTPWIAPPPVYQSIVYLPLIGKGE